MKEYIKLPVHFDIVTVTECWTFNRLTIIGNSPYYIDWIASHYNLYNSVYNFHFGDVSMHPPSYQEEILQKPIQALIFHLKILMKIKRISN